MEKAISNTSAVTNADILSLLKVVTKDIGELKHDVGEIKGDVGQLKGEVFGLKEEMSGFKADVSQLKSDSRETKREIAAMKQDVRDIAKNLQDCMQMTSEGLDAIDREVVELKERMDGIEGETRLLKGEVRDLKRASYRHELQMDDIAKLAKNTYDEQKNMHIDMNEIFHRLKALHALHKKPGTHAHPA